MPRNIRNSEIDISGFIKTSGLDIKDWRNWPLETALAEVRIQHWRYRGMKNSIKMPTRQFARELFELVGREDADVIDANFDNERQGAVTTAGFILFNNNKALLVQRDGSHEWQIPAGIIQDGEEPVDAARRWFERLSTVHLGGSKPEASVCHEGSQFFLAKKAHMDTRPFHGMYKEDNVNS